MVKLLTEIEIQNVNNITDGKEVGISLTKFTDIVIEDDIDTLTNIATVTIPTKNTKLQDGILTIYKTTSNDNQESNYKEYQIPIGSNNPISIYSGYNNQVYEVFKGYIVDANEVNATIVLNCEDEMNRLKRGKSLKQSFPNPLQANIIRGLTGPIQSDKFVGKQFTLAYFLLWMFEQAEVDIDYDIITYDLALGKLRLTDYFNISQLFKFLKDRYGLYIYFRNVYPFKDASKVTATRRLYIGYKYWLGRDGILINDYTGSEFDSFTLGEQVDTYYDNTYMYPYSHSSKDDYQKIITNNLEFHKTDKDKLIVIVQSVQTKSNSTIFSVYPSDKAELVAEIGKRTGDNNTTSADKDGVKSTLNTEDELYTTFETNRDNRIRFEIPDLDQASADKLAKESYDNYADDGYAGSFEVFGSTPINSVIQIGDLVTVKLSKTNINGDNTFNEFTYYVDRVVRTISADNGYRQIITIGNRYIK